MSYFSQHTNKVDSEGFFELFLGALFFAPYDMLDMLLPSVLTKLFFGLYCLLLMFFTLFGFSSYSLLEKKDKTLMLKLIGFYIFSLLFVYFIRDKTPWYMTYSLTLSFNLIFSMLIWVSLKRFKNHHFHQYFYWVTFLVFTLSLISLMDKLNNNKLYVHGEAWNNIRTLSTKRFDVTGFEIPAYLASKHTKLLCENPVSSLHGPYASLIHSHSGIEILGVCPEKKIMYGALEETYENIFAVPGVFAQYVHMKPIKTIGDAYFYAIKSVSNQQSITEEDFLSEYQRKYHYQDNWQNKKMQVTVNRGKQLVITKLYGSFSQIQIYDVSVNGVKIKPREKTNYSTLYQCLECNSKNSIWKVEFSESVQGSTNIVSF